MSTALALTHITKRFGDVVALDNVSLQLQAGHVHALLGENGAGKTTLMRVAFGMLHVDASPNSGAHTDDGAQGHVTIGTTRCPAGTAHSPAFAMAHGLGMVHQHFTLVPALTVAENIVMGGTGRFHPRDAAEQIRALSRSTGLEIDPEARVATLSVQAQQRCEILKALARDARVLVLDEPTAVLAPNEAAALLQWLREWVNHGRNARAAVLITHKLRDALAVADAVTVLRRGRVVADAPANHFTLDTLADAMLGADQRNLAVRDELLPHDVHAEDSAGAHDVVVQAIDVTVQDRHGVPRVKHASLSVRAGEIVGIAAVEGSGQHELLRAVSGRMPLVAGRMHAPLDTEFVPEDRHKDALLLDASLTENLALRNAGDRRGRMDWPRLRARCDALLVERDVRTRDGAVIARTLSGGNQQKFVLARALDDAPRVLVVENPTRGLDFRAAADVHAALRAARDAGIAVLLYSSDLDEVLSLADRVLAMHHGEVHEVPNDREMVGRAMLGAVR